MVLPFDLCPQIHQRYALLSPPRSKSPNVNCKNEEDSEKTGEQYASFLRSLSNGNQNKSSEARSPRQKTDIRLTRARFKPVKRAYSDGDKLGFPTSPIPIQSETPPPVTIAAVLRLKVKNDEDHEKKMKVIEDHMWQHKQKERELKRAEGDIIKKQRQLKKTMHDYEAVVYKKQRHEELMVNESTREMEKARQMYTIQDERLTRSRAERNASDIQNIKEKERKGILVTNNTEFQYEKVAEAIRRKRQEVENMSKEFGLKLKMKEEEEFKLKKQLADLAINVNVESHKQRVQKIDNFRNQQQKTTKDNLDKRKREEGFTDKTRNLTDKGLSSEKTKRRFSQDLNNTLAHVTLQIREEGRKMTDVKSKLQDNSLHQRNTHTAANYNANNRQSKESEEQIKMVEARRARIHDLFTKDRQQRSIQSLDEWKSRYFDTTNETKRRIMEDSINHLQKVVTKQDETEHNLYNQVRSSESLRRKQETNVHQMKMELDVTKKENQKILKETAIQCQTREKELQQRLLREEAMLRKYLTEREEKIQKMVIHRSRSQVNRHMLKEEVKVHDRLFRIGQRTDAMEQELYP